MRDSTVKKEQPPIVPYLYYENVEQALCWLAAAFGFRERDGETLRSPEGRVVHAAMDIDGRTFMLGSPGADYRNPKHLGGTTQNLYVHVENVEAHYARAKHMNAHLLSEIGDAFYGDRRYGVEDPEGHHWYFAQTIKQVAPTDWQPSAQDLEGHE
jgi:uncharacterized glyoxalase superfamily protein PhnB